MADIVISGNTSGSVTLRAPDTSGSTVLTLPTSSGTLVVTGGAQTVQFAAGSAAAPSITFTGDTNTGIFSPAADSIAFTEGGVESMRIDASGNVGIGTSSPTNKLDVVGNMIVGDGGNTRGLYVGPSGFTGAFLYRADGNCEISPRSGYSLLFMSSPGGTERMRIDSSGNVGIGLSNPSFRLDVARGSSGVVMNLQGTDAYNAETGILFSSQRAKISGFLEGSGGIPGTSLRFFTMPNEGSITERMRIDSIGNVIIGGTAVPNNTANRGNLTINGTSNSILNLTNGNSTTEGGYFYFDGTSIEINSSRASSVIRVRALTNGVVLNNGATSWSAASDERIKDIIEPITDGLNKVASLRSVIGKYKTDAEGTRRSFLIAQDVQAVLPEAVIAQNDEIGTLTLSYTDTIPLLVKAIQELNAKVEAQAAEIAALKGVN